MRACVRTRALLEEEGPELPLGSQRSLCSQESEEPLRRQLSLFSSQNFHLHPLVLKICSFPGFQNDAQRLEDAQITGTVWFQILTSNLNGTHPHIQPGPPPLRAQGRQMLRSLRPKGLSVHVHTHTHTHTHTRTCKHPSQAGSDTHTHVHASTPLKQGLIFT